MSNTGTRSPSINGATVKHELYTTITNIPKFCGDTDSVDVETFLNRVDTHIENKGVNNDQLKMKHSSTI